MTSLLRHAVVSFLAALVVGCVPLATRNLCEEDGMEHVGVPEPRDCHRCSDDADCIFQGNVCEGTVYCAHRDVGLVSTDIGCSPEPRRPSDDDCLCRDGRCAVR